MAGLAPSLFLTNLDAAITGISIATLAAIAVFVVIRGS